MYKHGFRNVTLTTCEFDAPWSRAFYTKCGYILEKEYFVKSKIIKNYIKNI
jgi:hypothetical protein